MKLHTAAVTALIIMPFGLEAAQLEGSQTKEFPANAKAHVLSLSRTAADEAGKKMIAAAEAAQPDKNEWWITRDGKADLKNKIKVPYAITGEALNYYFELIKAYQKKAFVAYNQPNSKLNYTATAKHKKEFKHAGKIYANVYVVTMDLKFNANFTEDATTGVHVMKKRTVILDVKGKILAIDGDNDTWGAQLAI